MDKSYYQGRVTFYEQKYGLPSGVLHAIVGRESGYNPNAKGPTNDLGISQFIPGTARTYGLKVGNGVDERLDPEKALDAAARLVRDLNKRARGDWRKIGIGYNAGAGRIGLPDSRIPKGALAYGAYMAGKQGKGGAVPPANAAGYVSTVASTPEYSQKAPEVPYIPAQNDALNTLQDGIIKPTQFSVYQPPDVRPTTQQVAFFQPDYTSLNQQVKKWSTW